MRYQNIKAFQKHLANAAPHHLCQVYLIQVADDFERAKAFDAILKFLPDVLLHRFNGNDLVLRDLFDALQSPSLLGGGVLVILDEAEKIAKKMQQAIADFLGKYTGYLVIGARAKTALLSAVEKEGVILDMTEEKPWDKEKRLAEMLFERAKNAGKSLSPDASSLLFERLDKECALLEAEIDKLICYIGDRSAITRDDVLAISQLNRTSTLWQNAEEFVWERGACSAADFHALIPLLRSQLHLGLILASLIETKTPFEKWSGFLPKLWPKTLEKRSSQAAKLGSSYFRLGLEKLFEIELLSRNNSTQYSALLDLLRAYLNLRATQVNPKSGQNNPEISLTLRFAATP